MGVHLYPGVVIVDVKPTAASHDSAVRSIIWPPQIAGYTIQKEKANLGMSVFESFRFVKCTVGKLTAESETRMGNDSPFDLET